MGVLDAIAKIFSGKKKIVNVSLDPETVKVNHQVQALAYENAEFKADNAKLRKKLANYEASEKESVEEENVKFSLDEQKREMRNLSLGKVFSLKQFFSKYLRDKKFNAKLGFYTFDRSTKIAGFGDICLSQDGSIVLIDKKGNLVMKMRNAKDLFQSVGALGNDVPTGRIPLWLDKEGAIIENVMEYESPELIPDGTGKLKFSKARKRPVFEIIQDLMNQLGETQGELAEAELINTKLQNKIDKLEMEVKVYENISETSRAELKEIEERTIGIDRVFRKVLRDYLNLQNLSAVSEDNLEKDKNIIEALRKEAERQNVKLSDDVALELVERIRGTLVNEQPDNPPPKEEKIIPK